MKKILLVCCAGMSTSLLVSKMEAAAKVKGIECRIQAIGETDAKEYIDDTDILLLGPQVRFLLSKFKKSLEGKNIPVEVIDSTAYGLCDAESILEQAKNMKKGE